MLKKLGLLVILVLNIFPLLSAHEFWLHHNSYWVSPNSSAYVSFLFGENFTGENWHGNVERVEHFTQYYPNNQTATITNQIGKKEGDSALVYFKEEGTYMLTYQGLNAFIELQPNDFKKYLEEDGLENIILQRKLLNEENKSGRELYKRCAKTIIQCGRKYQNANISKPTSLDLDIIPAKNPYLSFTSKKFNYQFQILFKSKPLSGKQVKIWFRDHGKTNSIICYTNSKGMVQFSGQHQAYMVSTVYMERLNNNPNADWQSYWGSLTFGAAVPNN